MEQATSSSTKRQRMFSALVVNSACDRAPSGAGWGHPAWVLCSRRRGSDRPAVVLVRRSAGTSRRAVCSRLIAQIVAVHRATVDRVDQGSAFVDQATRDVTRLRA